VSFEVVAFIALLVIGGTVGWFLALARGDLLDRLRHSLRLDPRADLESAVQSTLDERAAAAWQAQQRAADLAHVADLIDVGLVHVDDGLVVRFANQAAHAFLGRRAGALPGLTAIEAFADHRIEEVVVTARDVGSSSGELTLHGGEAPTVLLRARRSPVEGVWVVMEDVSELRRLQRIRAEFIDNLSHELRTPLTTVRLLTETLARDLERSDLPPRIGEGIQKIDVETGHLVQMVNELLDLSKIEQGTTQLQLDAVDLAAVVRASLDRLRLFADRQGVTLRTDLPAGLPLVRGDEERLGQLLINLLHNAVKFSSAGSTVLVRARREPGSVVVAVEDHGTGIPRAELGRVFERFYKVDKARVRGQGGTGLGLAIARHIVEGHDGRIWVESEEGSGSTFSFAIPTSEAA
jgi:two-component system phosphate regulon sensor histidine kinase PhoR